MTWNPLHFEGGYLKLWKSSSFKKRKIRVEHLSLQSILPQWNPLQVYSLPENRTAASFSVSTHNWPGFRRTLLKILCNNKLWVLELLREMCRVICLSCYAGKHPAMPCTCVTSPDLHLLSLDTVYGQSYRGQDEWKQELEHSVAVAGWSTTEWLMEEKAE